MESAFLRTSCAPDDGLMRVQTGLEPCRTPLAGRDVRAHLEGGGGGGASALGRSGRPERVPGIDADRRESRSSSLENAVRGAFCSRSVSTSGTHMHFTSGDDDERCERDKPGDKGVPIVYHPAYSKPVLPEGHRFPMPVFREIYKRLIRDGVAVPGANLYQPARMPSMEELLYAHDENYVDAFRHGALDETSMRKIGLPWSEALVGADAGGGGGHDPHRGFGARDGRRRELRLGPHRAHFDHGSGYCIFNDLAITAKRVIQRKAADRVLILDLDVHQGDGTANGDDASVFTLSVHCAENFPANKARSDRDVSLPKGTGDETYIKTVEGALRETLQDFKPNLVLYDAGVDVHEADKLGGLSITDEGLIRREALVLDVCVGGGVPVAAFVGGGGTTTTWTSSSGDTASCTTSRERFTNRTRCSVTS